jgi:hypothetical protein
MRNHTSLLSICILFTISLIVVQALVNNYSSYAATAGSDKGGISTFIPIVDKSDIVKPKLLITASCQAAQTDIPGEIIGTGFMPNITVIVKVDRNNNTEATPSEPVTLLLSKNTDPGGNVSADFTLNTQMKEPSDYRNYFVHVYSAENNQEATASLNVC